MSPSTYRYSRFIRPFLYGADSCILVLLGFYFLRLPEFSFVYYLAFLLSWFIIALGLNFYEVYRYTNLRTILVFSFRQFSLYAIVVFSSLGVFTTTFGFLSVFAYLSSCWLLVLFIKLFIYHFLIEYRLAFGLNARRVLLFGNEKSILPLKNYFINQPERGYQIIQVYSVTENFKPSLKQVMDFVSINNVHELYFSTQDLDSSELEQIEDYADTHFKTIKFIPTKDQVLFSNLELQFYDDIPVFPLRYIRMDDAIHKFFKRLFDIAFSLIVIIGILTWLTPILALLIKLESKGPVFIKQKRNGLQNRVFYCYKFRSMTCNSVKFQPEVDLNKITKIGHFMRKTSIDELPQFFNVLLNDMSVVGPRPHMVCFNEQYSQTVHKFMVRHFIKPGITGLAQTRGCRGMVENDFDIINRFKYDIFYMKNWSISLDMNIIAKTVYNLVKGDKKAY